ncbi:MAG: diacylglycerol kinase family protein [Acidobacteriota bacterium]
MAMAHLLVGNPTAQSGRNAERIGRARDLLAAAGIEHGFVATAPAGATVEVVAGAVAADPSIRTVISMGGDGTFAEVAKGILASGRARDVRLAMLPTGTANDQGKSFGLGASDDDLPRNVEVIRRGAERAIDVGVLTALGAGGAVVRRDQFFDSAGWGISPRVLQKRNEDRAAIAAVPVLRDVYRDHLVYAGAFARTFLASYVEEHKVDARAIVDGRTVLLPGLTDLVIKATRVYGGMWVFDRESQPDDGLFEVVPFTGKRDWISKALVHHDWSPVTPEQLAAFGVRHSEGYRGARIEVEFAERPGAVPLCAQIDGEEFPATPRAVIEVTPRALRLVVPEGP